MAAARGLQSRRRSTIVATGVHPAQLQVFVGPSTGGLVLTNPLPVLEGWRD